MLRALRPFLAMTVKHEARCNSTARILGRARPSQAEVPEDFRVGTLNGVNIYEITIGETQQHLRNHLFTSVDLVNFCLQRVQCVRSTVS